MISRKLSDPEKQQILELYHLPGETTSTLASRYGVSNSTISRILKQGLPADEYELLIQQKRAGRFANDDHEPASTILLSMETVDKAAANLEQLDLGFSHPILAREPEPPEPEAPEPDNRESEVAPPSKRSQFEAPRRRVRRRSSASDLSDFPNEEMTAEPIATEDAETSYHTEAEEVFEEILSEKRLEEHPGGLLDDEDDLDDDDLDDDDEDLEDDDEEGLPGEVLLVSRQVAGKNLIQVLPLAQAPIPRTCYLVVDRTSELIARPLREFGDLGEIPEAETLAKTLPIFDNHRVAKRYSNPRTQRVIKLPDGRVLQKTSSHLQAKGITRLLIDGQVYSL